MKEFTVKKIGDEWIAFYGSHSAAAKMPMAALRRLLKYIYSMRQIWHGMRLRCSSPKRKAYHRYGGRGIRVCDRWQASFESFLEDIGQRPSPLHTMDRIDNDGNYEPGNVRWATRATQVRNRSRSAKPNNIAEIARRVGAGQDTVRSRIARGLSPDDGVNSMSQPGECNPHSKLTAGAVLSIRARHSAGDSIALLAGEFQVNESAIRKIVKRTAWKHI
jgi:hypothetical protein